jgi:hypothetical protein
MLDWLNTWTTTDVAGGCDQQPILSCNECLTKQVAEFSADNVYLVQGSSTVLL